MDTLQCSFCAHENPVGAKFCNACGSSLTLQLCPACGAIDHISSRACYKCGAPLSGDASPDGTGLPAADSAAPTGLVRESAPGEESSAARLSSTAPRSARRAWSRAATIAVAITAGAALLYHRYAPVDEGMPTPLDTAPPVDAISGGALREPAVAAVPVSVPTTDAMPTSADPPALAPESPAAPASPDDADAGPLPATSPAAAGERSAAKVEPGTTAAVAAAARAVTPSSAPQPPAPRRARAAPAPAPQPVRPPPPEESAAPRYPCTDAVSALGLCD